VVDQPAGYFTEYPWKFDVNVSVSVATIEPAGVASDALGPAVELGEKEALPHAAAAVRLAMTAPLNPIHPNVCMSRSPLLGIGVH
jgi:hypothetical protein